MEERIKFNVKVCPICWEHDCTIHKESPVFKGALKLKNPRTGKYIYVNEKEGRIFNSEEEYDAEYRPAFLVDDKLRESAKKVAKHYEEDKFNNPPQEKWDFDIEELEKNAKKMRELDKKE